MLTPSVFGQTAALLPTVFLLTLLTLTGCDPKKKDDPTPVATLTNSVYVINEGTASGGAISLFDKTTRAVKVDLFKDRNGRKLGPFVQSAAIIGERMYVVVNGANRIEVVNRATFDTLTVIRGLDQPRYILPISADKAYVTEWQGAYPDYEPGRVAVLDLRTNTITRRLPVGIGPEQLVLADGRVYVTASYGTALTVIDPATDAVVGTVPVPAGSRNIVRDNTGSLWVLCSQYDTPTDHLVRFRPTAPTVLQADITFPNAYTNGNLRPNAAADRLYVSLSTGTYALPSTATALPPTPLIARNFYGLGVDPQDGTLYAGTASFSADSWAVRYTPAGIAIDSFQVSRGPNGFLFY